MTESLLQRAQSALAIQDVYLRDAHAWADRSFDPTIALPQPINLQIRFAPAAEGQLVTDSNEGESSTRTVRYLIETGVRVIKDGVDQESTEVKREDLLGEVTATFVLRYSWKPNEAPTDEILSAFIDNAIHHMWPYWREFLQASTTRLRLPPFMLPMRIVRPQPDAITNENGSKRESLTKMEQAE